MLWGLKVWMGSKAIRWIHDRYFHVRLLSMIRGTGNPWTTIYWKMKDCWRAGQRGRLALAKRMVHSFAKCPVSTTTRNGSSREGSGGSLLFVPFPYLYTLVRSSKASKPSLLWSWTVPALTASHLRRAAPGSSSISGPLLVPLQNWNQYCRCGCTSAQWVGSNWFHFPNMNVRNLDSAVFPPVKET